MHYLFMLKWMEFIQYIQFKFINLKFRPKDFLVIADNRQGNYTVEQITCNGEIQRLSESQEAMLSLLVKATLLFIYDPPGVSHEWGSYSLPFLLSTHKLAIWRYLQEAHVQISTSFLCLVRLCTCGHG